MANAVHPSFYVLAPVCLQVLLVDLDLGECSPPPDSSTDDAFLLPYAPKLLSALEVRWKERERLGDGLCI